MTDTLTLAPICGDAECTLPRCRPPATTEAPATAADVATPEEVARAAAFARTDRPLSEDARRDRLRRYPNPETVNIKAFLNACRNEAGAQGWCGTAQSMVTQIRVGPDKLHMLARHPQWSDELNDFDRWAVNPQVTEAGITEVPVAAICEKIEYIVSRGYGDDGYRTGMDNILSTLFVTYTSGPQPTYKAKVELDVTPELARRYGFNLNSQSSNADVTSVMGQMIRRLIYDGNVQATWTKEDAPAT